MRCSDVERILEYKKYDNIDYVLVEWKNKSKSWSKITNLSCKDLVRNFFKSAINILKEEEQIYIEEQRKEKEQILLNKMIQENMKMKEKNEEIQAKILSGFINPSSTKSKDETMPFKDIKKTQQLRDNPLKSDNVLNKMSRKTPEIYNKPSSVFSHDKSDLNSIQKRYPDKKRQEVVKVKQNNLILKIDDDVSLNLIFYLSNKEPVVSISSENISLVKTRQLLSYIYSQYSKENNLFKILPVANRDEKSEEHMRKLIVNDSNSILCRTKDFFWIVSPTGIFNNVFGIEFKTEYVIFRMEVSSYLESFFKMSDFIQAETQWAENIFKYGVNVLSDFVAFKYQLPQSKNIFIFGNKKLPVLAHICKMYERQSNIVDRITDSNLVIIQKSYLNFLHFIPGFYESLPNHVKFFLVENQKIEEILPYGGMITFTEEFIESAELISVSELIESISNKKNWYVKITPSVYATFKKRLSTQNTLPEYLHKMKMIYKVFKENVVEYNGRNLRDYLEMTNYKTNRYFLEVASIKTSNTVVGIEEAIRLVYFG